MRPRGYGRKSSNDYFFDQQCRSVDSSVDRKDSNQPFWRLEDPIQDKDGKITTGGLFPHQREIWLSNSFTKVLVAGYGAGKTQVGCKRIIALALENAPCPVATISPTFSIARRTVITQISELLQGKQNQFGQKFWWRYNSAVHEFKFRYHGLDCLIQVLSGERPLSLRGPNLAAAYMDEPFIQDLEVFQQMMARVRHPDAFKREVLLTGCVARNTLVITPQGLSRIGDLDPGAAPKELVPYYKLVYGLGGFNLATKFFNDGLVDTIRVKAAKGFELEASLEHPVLIMGKNGQPCWCRVDALKVGDNVAIQNWIDEPYYWAPICSLTPGKSEAVDFVIPETHSFWSNGFVSHNTPEGSLSWGYDLCSGEMKGFTDVTVVHASTRANKALDPGYVARLESVYSERAVQAYVEGKFINLSEGLVYYAFDPNEHVVHMDVPFGAELGAGMDFNVDPMAFCVFWVKGTHMHFFAEYELVNADTEYACQVLKENHWHQGLREIFPDAYGRTRSTKAPGGKSDFHYIRDAGFHIRCKETNPLRKDRYNSVNGKLRPKIGRVSLTIAPSCKKLIKYLSTYSHEQMNKQTAYSHLCDSFSYPCHYLFPSDRESLRVQMLSGF